MKFIDEVEMEVQAGRGGPGAKHFRREKFVPFGGPDGGNGGHGGSVILIADPNKLTLYDFRYKPLWKAEDGESGGGSLKDGKSGADLLIQVPVGTQIYRAEGGELIADLVEPGSRVVLAHAGRGGKGNAWFKTSTNQAPEYHQPGEEGESGKFRLSLKLIANVGLLGFPNAGKSTIISRISSARPKIADYPFTTLTPNLGVVALQEGKSFVVADVPGLIPGAHEGKGLGTTFLKHLERTQILVHLIDPLQYTESGEQMSPLDAFELINAELRQFSAELAQREQIVAITKVDAISPERRSELKATQAQFEKLGYTCLFISSASGEGIPELINLLRSKVLSANNSSAQETKE